MSTEQSSEPAQYFTPVLLNLHQDPAVKDASVEEKGPNESNSESPALDSTSLPAVEEPPEPFPEGGYGWICVLCSFAFHFFAIGIEAIWGVYQRFYFNSRTFPATNSQLAWVGSIQNTGVPLIGIVAGLLAEKIGYKRTSLIGTTVMSLALIIASFSTKLWHLYLTQGLLFGLGSGLAYIPAVTLLSQWFDKRRGLATGIAVSGSGIGGLVMSPLTQLLIDRLGFRWALRVTGLVTFGVLSIAGLFIKTRRLSDRGSTGTGFSFALIKTKLFLFLSGVTLFSPPGMYTPTFFVPDYATNRLGLSATQGATAVALIAGQSAAGRITLGVLGDRYGHINMLLLCQTMNCISQMALWPFTRSYSALLGFCAYFGFFSGGYISLYPVVAAQLYGTQRLASVAGAIMSASIPFSLAGTPIAGLILDHNTSSTGKINFLPAAMYGGAFMAASGLMVLVVKVIVTRSAVKQRAQTDGSRKVPTWRTIGTFLEKV